MTPLSPIADALHLLGKAIDPASITKVSFEFEHSPTDIAGIMPSWLFVVKLKGTKGIAENGDQVVSFDQSWDGAGDSEEGAIKLAHAKVVRYLQDFQKVRALEAEFAEQAVMTALSVPEDLQTLWSSDDSASTEVAEASTPKESDTLG